MNNKCVFKFKRTYGEYGYFAYIDNEGNFIVDHEAPREGGTIYSGDYPGKDSYIMKRILKDDKILYDSIVSYYKNNLVDKVESDSKEHITLSNWISINKNLLSSDDLFLKVMDKNEYLLFEVRLKIEDCDLYFGDCTVKRIVNNDIFSVMITKEVK